MNKPTLSRIFAGILILIFGLGALLDALNVFVFWPYVGTWWPVILIVAGILTFISNRSQYITSIVLLSIGAIFLINNLNFADVDVWAVFWPVIIIAIGVSVLINRAGQPKNVKTNEIDTVSAIFAGNEVINKSQDYKGGKSTAIFGGVTIDLRDAKIKNEATLEVFALCGGIELKIPREWKVQHRVVPILGGIESKSHSEKITDKSPILYITGTVALGGVEVKS